MEPEASSSSFATWVRRPETLVGLSAVVLSLCGLFIALYEASLIRQAQRASVWPYVEVAASFSGNSVELWVQNTGVGPARIQTAAVLYEGEPLPHWRDLFARVSTADPDSFDYYRSLIGGRVLPLNSSKETILALTPQYGPAAPQVARQVQRALVAGTADVAVCYCSVYDECWTSHVQDMIRRAQGEAPDAERRPVAGCTAAPQSGI